MKNLHDGNVKFRIVSQGEAGAVKSSLLPIYAVVKRPVGLLTTRFHKEQLKIDSTNVAATIGPGSCTHNT